MVCQKNFKVRKYKRKLLFSCDVSNPLSVNDLTLFQTWVILRFHQEQNKKIADQNLITGCCITAMDDSFNKEKGKEELQLLENSKYIRSVGRQAGFEQGFGMNYTSTVDGIIFAKKLMRPILTAMTKEKFKETIQKLDSPEAIITMQQLFSDSKTEPQQDLLSRLAEFGLRNISGFSSVLQLVLDRI